MAGRAIARRRAAPWLAVLACGALLAAGCGGARQEPAPAAPPLARPAAPAPPATPAAGPVRLGAATAYAALATTDVTVRARPGGGDFHLVAAKLAWGGPTPFLVRAARRDAQGVTWLEVLLPDRPNGSHGWVRRDQVRLVGLDRWVLVDLSARELRLYRGSRVERAFPVGIGRPGTPTPTGRFFVTVKLQPPRISPVYGAWALGLSAHSDVLDQFGTGDGQIALHGNARPGDLGRAVSHGCVRLADPAIAALAASLPVGSPVVIQP